MMDANELIRVYTVNEPTHAELIRAELQSEGIACEVSGENQAGFAGVLTIEILVRAKDHDRAHAFIEEHEHRLKPKEE